VSSRTGSDMAFFCLVLVLIALATAEPLYALRADEGRINNVVSTDPARGYMTTLIDLTQWQDQFPKLVNVTGYDANTDTLVFGNADPPVLALCNTLAKSVKIVHLPDYGQLLAVTAYDGVAYALFGLNEDVPTLGNIVTVDLETYEQRQIAKWKLTNTNHTYYVGTPFTFLPSFQSFMFQLDGSNHTWLLSVDENRQARMVGSALEGGWNSFWSDVAKDQLTVIAQKNGILAKVDPITGKVDRIHNFPCGGSGAFAVHFREQKIFSLSSCKNLSVETVTFANKTISNVELDPGLVSVVVIEAANEYTPYGCGAQCSIHPDCAKYKSCKTCRLGKCSDDGDCGSYCFTNADCFAGVCAGNCESNRCGRKGCASICLNHDECKAKSKTCQVCRLGRCSDAGECGAYCLSPTDCYGSSCLGKCNNYKCTP